MVTEEARPTREQTQLMQRDYYLSSESSSRSQHFFMERIQAKRERLSEAVEIYKDSKWSIPRR